MKTQDRKLIQEAADKAAMFEPVRIPTRLKNEFNRELMTRYRKYHYSEDQDGDETIATMRQIVK